MRLPELAGGRFPYQLPKIYQVFSSFIDFWRLLATTDEKSKGFEVCRFYHLFRSFEIGGEKN